MSNESNRSEFDAWFADAWAKYEDKEVTSEIKSKVWALKAWRHFVRAASANETGAEGVLIERLKLLLSGDAAFCKTIVARSAIEQAIAALSRSPAMASEAVAIPAGYALVPIEPTEKMIDEAKRYAWITEEDATEAGIWRHMLAAAPQSVPAAIPAGWQLVPVEPTEEMKLAGLRADDRDRQPRDQLLVQWDAMLAAVPQPAQADAPVKQRELPTMRSAFCVTEVSGDPDPAKQRFSMRFSFPSIEALHAADEEWRKFIAAAQADARVGLTDEQIRKIAEGWHMYKSTSVEDIEGAIRDALKLAAHPGQPEPRAEVTAWQPIATVVKSNAGPYLLINGQRIFSWLGTMYNDDADRIATVINDAARTGASS
ncbi:hypothetical protein KDX05_06985 [Burkholderia vietnamiensis]|uniref:hypothetical protein n=1 Tax=Burkholderia vietnamiensis TaxID=60552 RepID=UPI001B9626D9|nr:hypothetical protein [Burkholderia vietnamiensis]MBR8228055.1 hypothetical protein [Burkholderia vietnamiensis]